MATDPPDVADGGPVQIGARIRAARQGQQMSLRELARRIEVSPSFVSQLERGKANPSVGTLYAIVTVLGTSLDGLIGDALIGDDGTTGPGAGADPPGGRSNGGRAPGVGARESWPRIEVPVQLAQGRRRIQMSGVVWERLTHDDDPFVDFLHVEYSPGSASCADDDMMRHGGREYGHVLSGRLEVQVGFESYSLGPGDSIHFDSTTPHRLSNPYPQACTAIWFVLARRDDDRAAALRPSGSAHLPGLL